jgi:hypothetical protein
MCGQALRVALFDRSALALSARKTLKLLSIP